MLVGIFVGEAMESRQLSDQSAFKFEIGMFARGRVWICDVWRSKVSFLALDSAVLLANRCHWLDIWLGCFFVQHFVL